MALVEPIIFQVVGYQNSGKTTTTSKLITALSARELKTVTIKHHGHGGKPDVLIQKDSGKHLTAGAYVSIVKGEDRMVLQAEHCELNLEKQIELLKFFHPNVILIEGYKRENYPKMVLIRDNSDLPLLELVHKVTAVVYWKHELKGLIKEILNAPVFHIDDETAISWIVEFLLADRKE